MAKKKKAVVRRAPRSNAKSEKVRRYFRKMAKEKGHDYVGQLGAKTILPLVKRFKTAASSIYKYRTQVVQEGKGGNRCHKAPPAAKGLSLFDDVRAVKELGVERTRLALSLIDLVSE